VLPFLEDEMKDPQARNYLFGALFIVANRLQVLGDRILKRDDLTIKQWLLAVAVDNFFDYDPTVSEAAAVTGSSRQNVKQIALKLQRKGFMDILDDYSDKRIQRLSVSSAFHRFWNQRDSEDEEFLQKVFQNIPQKDIETAVNVLNTINSNISLMMK
jgi:MarR family transcriptional regulator for hemolysin